MMPKLNIRNVKFLQNWYENFVSWYKDQIDLFPPYGNYQGVLLGKLVENDKYYIDISEARLEVDKVTFYILSDGDNIKVRYTREGKRAINIDCYSDELPFQGNE
ncbi:MAG: hypothetical protein CL904_02005 [Dehalococcoidia bacterium]|nr:hypothetical protein [Dehalococcoidia bacterium]|tara:strand:- start:23610 stop:23921 length:312 start_codon:yes stop_codon:yes gene_type:complete